jgi:hypothetical protein
LFLQSGNTQLLSNGADVLDRGSETLQAEPHVDLFEKRIPRFARTNRCFFKGLIEKYRRMAGFPT